MSPRAVAVALLLLAATLAALYFTPYAPSLNAPVAIALSLATLAYVWRAAAAADGKSRAFVASHTACSAGLAAAAAWPRPAPPAPAPTNDDAVAPAPSAAERAPAERAPRPCSFSFCVTPGKRVDLTPSSCSTHTRNLADSLRRQAAGDATPPDRMCAKFSNFECVACDGACVDAATATCAGDDDPAERAKRDDREKPPDAAWQLTDEELLRSWQS